MTWIVSTSTFLIIAFSYFKILHACLKQADSGTHSKALQTCASHLVVYILYEISAFIIIVSYRLPSISHNVKKFFSIIFIIVPPAINPIIYGLVSKELRSSIIKHFSKRVKPKEWRASDDLLNCSLIQSFINWTWGFVVLIINSCHLLIKF